MNKIWWTQIPSARHFLEQITDALLMRKSVLLSDPECLPWADDLYAELESILLTRSPDRSLKFIDCPPGDIGRYFLENYCKKERRAQYRPTETPASFLARNSDIGLNQSYLCIKNIPPESLPRWKTFISEYYKAVPQNMPCAGFILEVPSAGIADTRSLVPLSFGQSISSYDSFTFCALAGAEAGIPEVLRPYLTEVVSTLCQKDVELCAACLSDWHAFFQDPVGRYCAISETGFRTDGQPFPAAAAPGQLTRALWEAQLKQLFPLIERYRSDFIRLHSQEIQKLLPVQNVLGEELNAPQDVELGILHHWAYHVQIQTSNAEYHTLDFFRQMRNNLAHLNVLSSEEVSRILGYEAR